LEVNHAFLIKNEQEVYLAVSFGVENKYIQIIKLIFK